MDKGSFKCYIIQWGGWGWGVKLPEKSVTKFNVITIMKGWVGVKLKKNHVQHSMASMLTGEHNKGNISMHLELWA